MEETDKRDGKVISIALMTLSADSKSMTIAVDDKSFTERPCSLRRRSNRPLFGLRRLPTACGDVGRIFLPLNSGK